jgi:hypothetical protein
MNERPIVQLGELDSIKHIHDSARINLGKVQG